MRGFYLAVALLVVIHTADMELTRHFIGDEWQRESFPPMRHALRLVGFRNAAWASRVAVYAVIYLAVCCRQQGWVRRLLITGTTLYWAAMAPWLFRLGWLHLPPP